MKSLKYFLALVICIFSVLSSSAYFGYNGLCYEINPDDTTTVRVIEYKTKHYSGDEFEGYTTYNYRDLRGKDITIPSEVSHNGAWYRVTKIGDKALYGVGIKSLRLSEGLEEIGSSAFSYNPDVDYFMFVDMSYQNNIDTLTLPSSVKLVGKDAFTGCEIKKLFVPSIGWWCDLDCRSSFPDGYDLYAGGEYVEDLVIPDGVESIRDYCFAGCNNEITSIDIPNSLKSVGTSALGAFNIDKINVHSLEYWCGIDFKSKLSTNYDLYLDNQLVEDVALPDGFETISDNCFNGCKSLKTVSMPNSVTSIGNGAFMNCQALVSVSLPDSLKRIGKNAFNNCMKIESLKLPYKVESLGEKSFYKCYSLKEVRLPHGLKTVEPMAFYGCKDFDVVVSYIDNPNSLSLNVSFNVDEDCVLWVPKGTTSKYTNGRLRENWISFKHINELPQSDVNDDFTADVRDITALINTILGAGTNSVDEPGPYGYALYDVNHDGVVDVKDVTYAIGEALGRW